MSDFNYLCSDCGITANNMTRIRQFGHRATIEAYSVSTFHTGICDVCGQERRVTELRDYFHPSERACRLLKRYVTRGKL